MDIYRTLCTRTEEYKFFWKAHGTFSRMENTFDPKTNINKSEKTKSYKICCLTVIEWIYVNSWKKFKKLNKYVEIKQLANQEIKDMKTEIRKYIEKDENKAKTHQKKKKWYNTPKFVRCCWSSA